MSEQRKWAVMRSGVGWCVISPHDATRWGNGRLASGSGSASAHFRPWVEAMAHADRMSRTVTVTLPRLDPEGWTTVGGFRVAPEPFDWGDALEVDELDDDGAYFILGQEDCEPLALALLAHARKGAH